MGPSGAGKSTFASGLAVALGALFIEGDDHHPPANRASMVAGRPLDDEMRKPWLAALGAEVRSARRDRDVVFACSALKRAYRRILHDAAGPFETVFLTCPTTVIAERMTRREHFMPPGLLESQIAALEPPTADEGALTFDVSGPREEILSRIVAEVGQRLDAGCLQKTRTS
ncbi:gluconokinase [Mesobaculum littorinae]|uniref:Gluconokinase n=1 Tax=Mesobaculum littorinae TaxID=2486419 RepID=A0A438AJN8_9RHOB|nr:gluconokinase [Mesobaculum littorinae]RVV98879.1 gluconokinase [Mesobaculum littorinae]